MNFVWFIGKLKGDEKERIDEMRSTGTFGLSEYSRRIEGRFRELPERQYLSVAFLKCLSHRRSEVIMAELQFFLAKVADQAERYTDVLTFLNDIIAVNVNLSNDERNLLSAAYKALTWSRRNALRTVTAFLEDGNVKPFPERVSKLTELKNRLISELDGYCQDLILLIDSKLLSTASNATTKVFDEKLKADYYRYSVEFETDDDRREGVDKAKASYQSAMAIATAELDKTDAAYLRLVLRYSVFLYEIIGQRREAIELADKSFRTAVDSLDSVEEGKYDERTLTLQLLKDKVQLWNEDDTASKKNILNEPI
jgi:14-3-3 protein epsilon